MAIGVVWLPPIDRQTYDTIKSKIWDAGQAAGLRFHAAGESPGGWRIIEVWDSREGLDRFIQESLNPTVAELGGGQVPPQAPAEVFDIYFQAP